MVAAHRRIGSAILLLLFLAGTLASTGRPARDSFHSGFERSLAGTADHSAQEGWRIGQVEDGVAVPLSAAPPRATFARAWAPDASAPGDRSAAGPPSPSGRPGLRAAGPETRPGVRLLAAPADRTALDALSRQLRARLGRLSSPSTAPPLAETVSSLG